MVAIHDSDTPAVAATNGFDRIVPSKKHDIILNCSPGDSEQLCQVFICICRTLHRCSMIRCRRLWASTGHHPFCMLHTLSVTANVAIALLR